MTSPFRRIRIELAYDRTDFHGWQVQAGLPTIQAALETILSGMEGSPVPVAGSGRTDAGVHALAQVAAFSIRNPIPVENLQRALNRLLPNSIRVAGVAEVEPGFHPRFDARCPPGASPGPAPATPARQSAPPAASAPVGCKGCNDSAGRARRNAGETGWRKLPGA